MSPMKSKVKRPIHFDTSTMPNFEDSSESILMSWLALLMIEGWYSLMAFAVNARAQIRRRAVCSAGERKAIKTGGIAGFGIALTSHSMGRKICKGDATEEIIIRTGSLRNAVCAHDGLYSIDIAER